MDRERIEELIEQIKEWVIDVYPDVKRYVIKGFPHAVIVIAGMMLVFFGIDRVNKHMGFMTNEFHKVLSMLLSVSCIGYSIDYIRRQREAEREAEAHRRQMMRNNRPANRPMRPQDGRPSAPRSASSASRPSAPSNRPPVRRPTSQQDRW